MKLTKNLFIIILIGFFSILSAKNFDSNDYQIYSSPKGKKLSMKKMAKQLKNYDVIFFGEWHDDNLLHQLEADILPLISKKNQIAISMEMFERDVQPIVNDFLSGKIEEQEFLKEARAWGNYLTDYKPIVDFAKENKVDVLAANVPRKYASMISKKGIEALNSLPENEKKLIAKTLKPLDNQYKKQFIETMSSNMGRKNAMGMKKMLDNIYAAQCLKDDTMAESIFQYLQKNHNTQIIHYNGNFHSESHLGTANKLHLLNPKLKIAVITPVIVADGDNLKYDPEYKDFGDFLIFAHRFSSSEEKEVKAPKMFNKISNTILSHKLNLKIEPNKKFLSGYDEISLSKEITKNDTIFLLSALKVKNITIEEKAIKYQIIDENEDYQGIIFLKDIDAKKIKIEYAGEIYFPLKGRNLNQTHDGTMGIISDKENEGIYLPGANWYPIIGEGLADFDIIVSCPEEFQLLTSGKESRTSKNGMTIYNWKSELPVDHIYLVGNKFVLNSRIVNNVKIGTYLLPEDAKFADSYLDGVEKYLLDYSKLFGEYPFSSFSVVENFFASGFGMPNFTLLSKEIVKMPFVTLSPGVIAHEFCHNWWGNSVYVDYENGNWCEAITVFSSNYYQNILKGNLDKAKDWRKQAILDNNLLPEEKRFPLKEFVYQHNDDEAVIGYQKGAMLFVNLYQLFGKELFFETVKDFYKINKGKIADWNDWKNIFKKHNPKEQDFSLDEIFDFWLNSTSLSYIKMTDVKFNDKKLSFSLMKETPIPLQIPIKITLKNGQEIEELVSLTTEKIEHHILLKSNPAKIEIDPNAYILKTISNESMPYNLNRTLNDKPIVILPEKGEMVTRLQMVASMLTRSGYEIQIKSAVEVTDEDLQTNSLFILGEFENNSVLRKLTLLENFKVDENSLEIDGNKITGKKGSVILSYSSPYNQEKSISIYTWNSAEAIASFRKMFHYMNDSWQIFDLDVKEKGALKSDQIFPKGQNDLIFVFE